MELLTETQYSALKSQFTRFLLNHFNFSLRFQTLYGVHQGGFDGLVTHR